jgi:hypothetical protein
MKPETNKVFTFKLRGRQELITGIVLDVGEEWIMLRYIPVDYVIDGHILIRKKYINSFWREKEETFIESVLKAKNSSFDVNDKFPLADIISPFHKLQNLSKVIQFDLGNENLCYIGIISKLLSKSIVVKNLSSKGLWQEESNYKIDSIRTIQFDCDYIISLLAYNKSVKTN